MASIEEEEDSNQMTVLVTGFGAFLDVKTNPSCEIASRLPPIIQWKGINIKIISHEEPLKAAYHDLATVVPPLLEQYNPDIVLHIGLAVERSYFAIEKGAEREGYHQYPDVSRKVFTKVETKKAWGKSPPRLDSNLDFEDVLGKWKRGVGKGVDVRLSDDVGSYVCGFVYYTSLEHYWKREDANKAVVFMHVPPLNGEKDIEKGKGVVVSLIQSLAESRRL